MHYMHDFIIHYRLFLHISTFTIKNTQLLLKLFFLEINTNLSNEKMLKWFKTKDNTKIARY